MIPTHHGKVEVVSADLHLDLLEVAHHPDAGPTPLRVHIYHWTERGSDESKGIY